MVVCCLSSCAVLFDFLSFCGVHLIHIEKLIIQSKIWATLQIWRHEYSDHFNFIIYFVCIMPLHAINFDTVSLFTDLSFTFLVMLNDVLYRFE